MSFRSIYRCRRSPRHPCFCFLYCLLLHTCLRGITPIAAGKTPGGLPPPGNFPSRGSCLRRHSLFCRYFPLFLSGGSCFSCRPCFSVTLPFPGCFFPHPCPTPLLIARVAAVCLRPLSGCLPSCFAPPFLPGLSAKITPGPELPGRSCGGILPLC